jgi:hypothetical protein
MKKVLLILIMLVTIPAMAQDKFIAVNVKTNISQEQTFHKVGQILAQHGFFVNYSDISVGGINTEARLYLIGGLDSPTSKLWYFGRLSISVDDGVVTIYGMYEQNTAGTTQFPVFKMISLKGDRKSLQEYILKDMEILADAIGGEVTQIMVTTKSVYTR